MDLVNLTVDVSCGELNVDKEHINPPVYRLYIDSELMCERSWWERDRVYIKEHIYINIDSNKPCCIFLDQSYSGRIKLKISNLDVLTHQFQILNSDSNSITFRIV